MTPKAYSYARFSSTRQAEGNSLKRQLEIAREWYAREIAPLGLPLDDLKCDDGYSAYRGVHVEKGSLGHFLAEIKAGSVARGSVLIAENLDRISRQGPKIARKIIEAVVDNGVDMHICNIAAKLTYGWENDHSRSIIVDVELGRACQESRIKSDRIGAARKAERERARETKRAITARVPFWLKAKIGGEPIVIAERADTVRRIFDLAGLGMGGNRIVRTLEAEKRAPFRSDRGKQGAAWTPEYVQKILGNRAVLGEYQPHRRVDKKRVPEGEVIRDFFPSIISREQWQAARHSVDAKNPNRGKPGGNRGGGRQGVNSLFSPLVYDADNGGTMVYRKNPGTPPYLVTKWQRGKKSHYLRYDRFERAFLGFLSDLDWRSLASEAESPEVKASRAELETVLSDIEKCQARLVKLQTLVAEGSFSHALFAAVDGEQAKLVDYSGKREKLAAELAMARSRAASLERPEDLLALIRSGDPEMRLKLKAEIRKRISRIEVSFGLDGFEVVADIRFVNGAVRGIILDGDRALLLRIAGTF